MDYNSIVVKIGSKEELSDDEIEFLSNYKGEEVGDDDKIPKQTMLDRVKREKDKRISSEETISDLQGKITDLDKQLSDIADKDLSEQERKDKEHSNLLEALQTQVDGLSKDKGLAEARVAQLDRFNFVSKLASVNETGHQFKDADYLNYLMTDVDIANVEDVNGFLTNQIKSNPERFVTEIKGGSADVNKNIAVSSAKMSTLSDKVAYLKDHSLEEYEQQININKDE